MHDIVHVVWFFVVLNPDIDLFLSNFLKINNDSSKASFNRWFLQEAFPLFVGGLARSVACTVALLGSVCFFLLACGTGATQLHIVSDAWLAKVQGFFVVVLQHCVFCSIFSA